MQAATLAEDLKVVAGERIYFGHQSVGANILDGLKELSSAAGVPLRIAEAPRAAALHGMGVGHVFVPENGNPLKKLASFEAALGEGSQADVAFLKFCYVDITADTDPRALFADYRRTIDELRAKNPRTTFIHVTVPLTTVQVGPKAWAKRLLGRAPSGTVQNVKREQYNMLLRRTYAGREPIFDIARVESVAADGIPATVEWGGAVAPALVAAYTDDGGHLNRVGRLRAAQELVTVLAAARRPLQKFEDSATAIWPGRWLNWPPQKGTVVAEETVYMRTTRKALEAAGGVESLAQQLARPLDEIKDWLAGRVVPPDPAFLDLLEIVSRRR